MHDDQHCTAMDLTAWKAQLRKGAAELAVLSVLDREETYGVDLLERIQTGGGLDLAGGSIYPLLNRLQNEGKIRGRWVEDDDASHPRKYYALTKTGRAVLAEMVVEWAQFEAGMRMILGEEVSRARK